MSLPVSCCIASIINRIKIKLQLNIYHYTSKVLTTALQWSFKLLDWTALEGFIDMYPNCKT